MSVSAEQSNTDADPAFVQHNVGQTPNPYPPRTTPLPLCRDRIGSEHVVLRKYLLVPVKMDLKD